MFGLAAAIFARSCYPEIVTQAFCEQKLSFYNTAAFVVGNE
jgi:hypothetical protein